MRILLKFLLGTTLVIIAIAALMLVPSPQPTAPKPWEVTVMPDNQIQVMGVHLGTTTYGEIQQLWREAGEAALFISENDDISAEVFFESINLGGLSARTVLNLQLPEEKLQAMAARAVSAKLQPSGARRYDPAFDDKQALLAAPAIVLTYIPSVRLDEEMVHTRFGEPEQIQNEAEESPAQIWHYPNIGLTIRLHPEERPMLTYTARSS
ncbi:MULTISPECIES: lytic murein transglycosylase [unclassified Methylophaga]|jgi:hypothetical protein|uniref:lytic murein transglycosylase n=1 Tax=unclassified Methylophaga TaxID=2629249 RepID=UPI0025F85E64|nr:MULTISPECIES: lytic murein transglycosylase [unclassified Methylophaga]|tara:strand:+ start:2653 stop:3279 length:627 start_codon:yes stop_codon:yes gene_type:complete